MLPKLLFISLLSSLLSATLLTHSYSQCLDYQKTLLLQLKHELIFNSSVSTKLVQWNQTRDCCMWYGVECDAEGYIISLQLDEESISGGIGESSSLFRLKHLEKLNLAYNDLDSNPIPKGIHSLTYLTHLNLSYAGFGGQVPAEISSLTRLVSLDISNEYWPLGDYLSLEHPNLEMLLQNLTRLRELYLDGVHITSSDRSHIISSYLPHLTTLSLRSCNLSGHLPKSFWQLRSLSILRLDVNDLSKEDPNMFAKFSNLSTLTLARCSLNGSFPNTIFQIPTLQNIDLSENALLSGSLPPFNQRNGSLKSIMLTNTNFSGLVPSSISNLKNLSHIDLYKCKFTGSIPSTLSNLTQLTYVDLSFNLFKGSLPCTLFEGHYSLVHLGLASNSFSGDIPHSLFRLPSLLELQLKENRFAGKVEAFSSVNIDYLDLSGNQLEGPIPDSLFQLQSLKYLDLSRNLFTGSFQLEKIRSISNLTFFSLSGNKLSVNVGNGSSSSYGLPQLTNLNLQSCNMNGFPHFIKHSPMINFMDLSNNWIAGEIPNWIWGRQLFHLDLSLNFLTGLQKPYHIHYSLEELDLSSNRFKGELHPLIPPEHMHYLWWLSLSNNSLSGSIPTSICSTKLGILNLSFNRLSGNIPSCLFENTMSLIVLDLGRNNISGRIPDNFALTCSLMYVQLNNNNLQGKLPKSLENCKDLVLMNVGNNFISDVFPCMLPSSLRFLNLHSNSFHGEVTCHNNWPDLQILDISSNHFNGSLASVNFSSWKSNSQLSYEKSFYHVLLSSSMTLIMKGQEAKIYKIWSDFIAIDLSCNNFRGEIPDVIGDLSLLCYLNLSQNALRGNIPKSFGKLRKLESLDLSQNQLTGVIPMELAGLTFLSFLNLSYNMLVGRIPNGRQLQTFTGDSFNGNPGLCGFNLNISCGNHIDLPERENEEENKREIEWEYVTTALGYVVGVGSIVWLLLFHRSFRRKYFDKIDEVVEQIFDARDTRRRRRRRRRRRASARRRVVRNGVQRQ